MATIRVERDIAGRTLLLETGKVARQADGAVWVRYGDTVVLATALSAPCKRDIDYFPLFVDYREYQYAAGKVPGGFFKREGRPSAKEILTSRMIDRPIRPLFPSDFRDEVQLQCLVLSTDNENDPDLLAVIGASAALALSPAPFAGPVGAARVGYADGEYLINPTHSQLSDSVMDLFVCGPANNPNMIEMAGREAPDEVVAEGIRRGFEVCRTVLDLIHELVQAAGVQKTYQPTPLPDELKALVADKCGQRIREAKQIKAKVERGQAIDAIQEALLAELCPEGEAEPTYQPAQVAEALYKVEGEVQRKMILDAQRPDGRGLDEIRPLTVEVGVLPRTHGSAIFAREETQALVTTTLGTPGDQQIIDGLLEEYKKHFMLHYNFPPFSVGEIRPIRGPGRREIGHGALAEKSLEAVMPDAMTFPYTVRAVADILESNGSTSMATVCGATLALMDAGVPIKAPVAGISIGMVSEGDRWVLLTDIIGEEDFHGDMDFKVAGTAKGITGIQLDMKAPGISQEQVVATLARAREARLSILEHMTSVIAEPRASISQYAPRMITVKIDPEKIGKVIGPGGKTINRIQDETGAKIDIEDDGTVYISCVQMEGAEAARREVELLTEEVELGKIYEGKVVSIRDFGAFLEILPGQDALCHVSELDEKYVKNVQDVCSLGDVLKVKVINIDDQGRVKVSRKAAMRDGKTASKKGR
jgi:polyribonucleotide nucleotidyltransferase